MFTRLNSAFSSGKMYLGMYTFLISCALVITESMAMLVASLKKLKISWPLSRYTGNSGGCPVTLTVGSRSCRMMLRNRYWNTKVITSIISRGLKTLHAMPSTLRRYFTLKSRFTRLYSR